VPERIVVVEDHRDLREFLAEALGEAGYSVEAFPTADAALPRLLAGEPADLVVTDLVLPGMRGHELLQEIRARRPELNVVVITAFGSIDSAIEMMKAGAYDYLTKPFGTDELLLTVERALQESRLRREVARLSRAAAAPPPGFVGASRPMQELFQLLGRIADSGHAVLITGESGTGKELVAHSLHRYSSRSAFVAVNCAALPEHLLESELFGHVKGAFTGADRDKVGLFHAADGGTLFLDEVGELPPALQPKLLRVLESSEVRRVGATEAHRVDVRLVAATNRDLEEEVREGRFREDLFWRLNVLHVVVPPLRERTADIPLLAEHFLAVSGTPAGASRPGARRISREALAMLTSYPWPGNVRELRNAIARAATLATTDVVHPEDLPPRVREVGRTATLVADASQRQLPLRELEREYILEVLRQTGGNKSRAAEILGLDRKTLYRKLAEFGQDTPSDT
jgi:two-component system response regulator PilR (NtrC family)/two-component system response regulator HydG